MRVVVNQPFGLGDVLFLSPLIKQLDVEHGVWPIVDHYFWIKEYVHIPTVEFIKQSEYDPATYLSRGYTEIPFLNAQQLVPQSQDCMEAKYLLLGAPPDLWTTLSITRNFEKEQMLMDYLGISSDRKFVLVNNNFAGPEFGYRITIDLPNDADIIYVDYIDGFTLLDWCGVLEQAQEIHTVSTSIYFVIESLKIYNKPLHLYPRKPLDTDLSPIKSLLNKNWICHE